MLSVRLVAFAVLVAAASLSPSLSAARPCSAIDEDARATQSAGDLEKLIGFYTEAHDPAAGCEPLYLADFGRDVALAHIDRFFSFYDKDKDGAAHKAILEAGRQFGEPWQLLLTLAEVEAELGNTSLPPRIISRPCAAWRPRAAAPTRNPALRRTYRAPRSSRRSTPGWRRRRSLPKRSLHRRSRAA